MMKTIRTFVADFETLTFEGIQETAVWLAGFLEVGKSEKDIQIYKNIDEFMKAVFILKGSSRFYFVNLKFDGSFILNYLISHGFNDRTSDKMQRNKMRNKDFSYLLSDKGLWYTITVKYKNKVIEFYDLLKLIPLSVKKMAKAFSTPQEKGKIDYTKHHSVNEPISFEELEYFKKDLLIPAKALEEMFDNGYNKMTIGSSCLHFYKQSWDKREWGQFFPDLYSIELAESFGSKNVGEYVRKSYRGGWCYVKKSEQLKKISNGFVVDANSLYSSVMYDNPYPVGQPYFFKDKIPDEVSYPDFYFFVRVKIRFRLKKNHLPFIQIKHDLRFNGREMLEESTLYDNYGYVVDDDYRIMTFTCIDFYRVLDFYDCDYIILDGCFFNTDTSLFQSYIDHFMNMKIENNDNQGKRTIAKLSLNNLYGKFSTSTDSSYKTVKLVDGVLKFSTHVENDKKGGYIPIGAAVTSYARDETIRKAQLNYKRFIYADTDSLHCHGKPDDLIGVPIHDTKLKFWKVEQTFESAFFNRAKSYIECIQDGDRVDYSITCAGMRPEVKDLFRMSLLNHDGALNDSDYLSHIELYGDWTTEKQEVVDKKLTLSDFRKGLTLPCNLKLKQIKGGCILERHEFKMRI